MRPRGIVRLRERLGFSPPQFARFLDLAPITVHRWESGKGRPAGLSRLVLHALDKAARTNAGRRRIAEFHDLAELIEVVGWSSCPSCGAKKPSWGWRNAEKPS